MKMFIVLALAAFAAAEPEADPQLLMGGIYSSYTPYSLVAPVATYASPLWKNMIPALKSVVPAGIKWPMTMVYGAQYPMTHGVVAEPTKIVTNFINKDHYTAEATPLGKALGVPSYTAKNGEVVHEVQKREAEAEAEPAIIYPGLMHTPYAGINTAYTAGMMSPLNRMMTHRPIMTYNAIKPVISSYMSPYWGMAGMSHKSHMMHKREAEAEADPAIIYPGLIRTPYAGINTAYTAGMMSPFNRIMTHRPIMTYNAVKPVVSSYMPPYWGMSHNSHMMHKREAEAEADPAIIYPVLIRTPYAGINTAYTAGMMSPFNTMMAHHPTMTYNTIKPIAAPITWNGIAPINTVYKTKDHGVVATHAGLVHSSLNGMCLNNEGVQVSC